MITAQYNNNVLFTWLRLIRPSNENSLPSHYFSERFSRCRRYFQAHTMSFKPTLSTHGGEEEEMVLGLTPSEAVPGQTQFNASFSPIGPAIPASIGSSYNHYYTVSHSPKTNCTVTSCKTKKKPGQFRELLALEQSNL